MILEELYETVIFPATTVIKQRCLAIREASLFNIRYLIA